MDFLKKHPTPWKYNSHDNDRGPRWEEIVDANGEPVIVATDYEQYQAYLTGDVDELIEFVNSL